jgi:hypothetical protein
MVIFGLTFAVTMWMIALSYGLISKLIKARTIRTAPDNAMVALDKVYHVHTFCPWCHSNSCKLRVAPFDLMNPFLAIVECRRGCGYKLSSGGKRLEKDATDAVTTRHHREIEHVKEVLWQAAQVGTAELSSWLASTSPQALGRPIDPKLLEEAANLPRLPSGISRADFDAWLKSRGIY